MKCMLKIDSMGIAPGMTNGVSDHRLYVNQVRIGSYSSEEEATQQYIAFRERLKRLHNVMSHFADRYASNVSAGMKVSAGSYLELYVEEVKADEENPHIAELINTLIDPKFIDLT